MKCMSEIWKIIFFFHPNKPKTFFSRFSRLDSYQSFYHNFQDTVRTLGIDTNQSRSSHLAMTGTETVSATARIASTRQG